jgi:DNA-3-methyladenine glycosylase II
MARAKSGSEIPVPLRCFDGLRLPVHTAAENILSKICPLMRRLIRAHGPCTLEISERSPWEALVSAVAHQQLNARAAQSILTRFRALYQGTRFPKPAEVLATPEDALRASGFSFGKIRSIRDIAEKTASGVIPTRAAALKLTDDDLIERLTAVRGVGRWTVEMLLIFTLGRGDVFPSDDFGVRTGYRIAMKLAELPRPKDLRDVAQRWQPHRTLAAWYLWRAADATK